MVSARQRRKAKLIHKVGATPVLGHACTQRCYEIAAEIAAAESCDKCESHYELVYFNEKHLVSRLHKPGCPNLEATPIAKDVHGIANGKLIATDITPETALSCPLGCEMHIELKKTGSIISHQPDCALWRPDSQ